MDNSLTPEEQNALIEAVLHNYPVMDMPRDITVDVLGRIQGIPAPRPFRLTWNDFVVGLLLSLCVGAIGFSLYNLPPMLVAQIRKESILLYQHMLVNARWLLPVISLGLAGILVAFTIPFLGKEWWKSR